MARSAAWYVLAYWQVPEAYSASYVSGTQTVQQPTEQVAAPTGAAGHGQAIFAANCAACHQATGLGLASVFPPLKGNPVAQARDAGPLLKIVLQGLGGQAISGVNYPGHMPAFAAQLNDQDLADVTTYVRSAWGNQGGPVTAADVAAARK